MALDFPNSPIDGQEYEGFVYSSATGAWRVTKDPATATALIEYLVIGGGGRGGNQGQFGTDRGGGGGGAGGFRSSMPDAFSGGASNPETALSIPASPTAYTLTVGAGGGDSTLGDIVALAGGAGGNTKSNGSAGGSGGGAGGGTNGGSVLRTGGVGAAGQGTNGQDYSGAGGGNGGGSGLSGAAGRTGLQSFYTQDLTVLANGGAGAAANGGSQPANTGNGGAGGGGNNGNESGQTGGSGLIVIAVPSSVSVSFSGGVTQTSTSVGDKTVYTVTAAGPTDTVTIG